MFLVFVIHIAQRVDSGTWNNKSGSKYEDESPPAYTSEMFGLDPLADETGSFVKIPLSRPGTTDGSTCSKRRLSYAKIEVGSIYETRSILINLRNSIQCVVL